jgi:IS5 family transposase
MKQTTFSSSGFDRYAKTTKREIFLAEMDQVVPWPLLCELMAPHYPDSGTGRPPVGLERMLRIYCLQQWFNLSDPAAEEALYDVLSMRRFVGIDLGRERARDETTICRFRHFLEAHDFGKRMFELIHEHLEAKGVRLSTGTIVDATIINAPSSTKNEQKARDPDMHQTKKGNQWYFGMKAHFGVDRQSKVVHAVVATAANVHDSTVLEDLLHGEETDVWGDSAYQGQGDTIKAHAPNARDRTNKRAKRKGVVNQAEQARNRRKSRVRARVEHVIGVIKLKFGFAKVRYRGLEKNANRLFATTGLANLYILRKRLRSA